jgi:hypothetical protein
MRKQQEQKHKGFYSVWIFPDRENPADDPRVCLLTVPSTCPISVMNRKEPAVLSDPR